MRNLMLLVLVLVSSVCLSQVVLDNKIWNGVDSLGQIVARDQTWSPTFDKMAVVWYTAWEGQLPSTEVRLRPNQYFDIFMDGYPFRVKLLSVTGVGNLRQSNYFVSYNSFIWKQVPDTASLYFKTVGAVFPVNLQSTTLPEEKVFQAVVRDVSKYYCGDSVYVTLRVFDPDRTGEGQLVINGNILTLFGSRASSSYNNQLLNWTMATPKTWWIDGTNNLKFVHSSYDGFKIDTLYLGLKAKWFKKDTVWVIGDTLHLPYTNFGEADQCGNIKAPSDSTHVGRVESYYFNWYKYASTCPDNQVTPIDSIHERLQISPITIGGAGSNTMVYLKVKHSEIPIGFSAVQPSETFLPTRRTTFLFSSR